VASQPLIDADGAGWCYTDFAGRAMAALALCLVEMVFGMWEAGQSGEDTGIE